MKIQFPVSHTTARKSGKRLSLTELVVLAALSAAAGGRRGAVVVREEEERVTLWAAPHPRGLRSEGMDVPARKRGDPARNRALRVRNVRDLHCPRPAGLRDAARPVVRALGARRYLAFRIRV